MKINLMGIRPNYQQINTSTKEVKEAKTQINREFVYAFYPVHPSFTGLNTKYLAIFNNTTNLHCPYCGVKMMRRHEYEHLDFSPIISAKAVVARLKKRISQMTQQEKHFFGELKETASRFPEKSYVDLLKCMNVSTLLPRFEKLRNEKLSPREYSKKIIDKLQPYEVNMRPIQKKVFNKIKKLNALYPEKSIEKLLLLMRAESLIALHSIEIGVLNRIDRIAMNLPRDTGKRLSRIIAQERKLLRGDNAEHFKRKAFFAKIVDLNHITGRNVDFSQIYQLAATLPTSSKNVDAFIVKYSGKVSVLEGNQKVYRLRSSREIAESLLNPSVMTLEHIIPQHKLADFPNLTPPRNANYFPTCAPCNNSDKSGMPLSAFLQTFPAAKANILRFMQDAIDATNAGYIRDLDYVKDVTKTIVAESCGAIKLEEIDLSKLDLHNASVEIAMKDPRFANKFNRSGQLTS